MRLTPTFNVPVVLRNSHMYTVIEDTVYLFYFSSYDKKREFKLYCVDSIPIIFRKPSFWNVSYVQIYKDDSEMFVILMLYLDTHTHHNLAHWNKRSHVLWFHMNTCVNKPRNEVSQVYWAQGTKEGLEKCSLTRYKPRNLQHSPFRRWCTTIKHSDGRSVVKKQSA